MMVILAFRAIRVISLVIKPTRRIVVAPPTSDGGMLVIGIIIFIRRRFIVIPAVVTSPAFKDRGTTWSIVFVGLGGGVVAFVDIFIPELVPIYIYIYIHIYHQ